MSRKNSWKYQGMDPDGRFYGDTLTVWWNPVQDAAKYLVKIDQCNDTIECRTVVDRAWNSTKLQMTSEEKFGICSFYHLEVIQETATHDMIWINWLLGALFCLGGMPENNCR